jgi:prolyl oligopeptidase
MVNSTDPRPTLSAPDDDPWLWLEEVEGERALAWVAKQNAVTLGRLADVRFEADRNAVKAALDRPDKLPFVTRRGGLLYNFWQDAAQPRGLWRRTTLASYRSPAPEWEALLDLDAMAQAEGEDWVWKGATTLPGTHDFAVLALSRGGGDAVVLREFSLTTRQFVVDGFVLSEAKGGVDWLDRDTLLLSSAFGEGMATRSGYARTVRLWSRGSDPAAAPVLLACSAEHMAAYGSVDRTTPGRLIFIDQLSFYDRAVQIGDRGGPRQRIDLPTDAEYWWQPGWAAVRIRSPWTLDGITHAPDTLLGIGLDALLAGDRHFRVLFTPSERRALQGFFWCNGRLVISVLDELRPVFILVTPGEAAWGSTELHGLPRNGVAHLWPLDAEPRESDGTLLAQVQDPITPSSCC